MDWLVIHCQDCDEKKYLYKTVDVKMEDCYCDKCNSTNYKFLKEDDMSAQDFVTILGNELEDANYHSFTNVPENLLTILQKADIEEDKCRVVMKEFSEMLWKEI